MIQFKIYSIYDGKGNTEYKFTITSAYKIKDCDKLKDELYFLTGPIDGNQWDL